MRTTVRWSALLPPAPGRRPARGSEAVDDHLARLREGEALLVLPQRCRPACAVGETGRRVYGQHVPLVHPAMRRLNSCMRWPCDALGEQRHVPAGDRRQRGHALGALPLAEVGVALAESTGRRPASSTSLTSRRCRRRRPSGRRRSPPSRRSWSAATPSRRAGCGPRPCRPAAPACSGPSAPRAWRGPTLRGRRTAPTCRARRGSAWPGGTGRSHPACPSR